MKKKKRLWYDSFGTAKEKDMIEYVKMQLMTDLWQVDSSKVSTLAKHLPSINTSSRRTVAFAHKFAKGLGLTPGQYRKLLSSLRSEIRENETVKSKREIWRLLEEGDICKEGDQYAYIQDWNMRHTWMMISPSNWNKPINAKDYICRRKEKVI